MAIIKDGNTGYTAKVDLTGKLQTRAVMDSRAQESALAGEAYNINTGWIGLTSSTDSAILYFKNNEDRPVILDSIALGITDEGTIDNTCRMTIVRNPKSGTIVSGATSVDIIRNRNFGAVAALDDSYIYKGAEGNTLTDGEDWAYFACGAGRLFADLDIVLNKGDSIGIKLDTQTSAGTTNVYAALICHLLQ